MIRKAFVLEIHPDKHDEYRQRHNPIWPELARTMGEAYLEAVRNTGARGLVSLDFSCLQHLSGIAAGRGWDLTFFHLSQILLGELEVKSNG